MADYAHMQWVAWFGQIVACVLGAISLLWMIAGGFLLALKVLSRREYSIEGDKLDYRH